MLFLDHGKLGRLQVTWPPVECHHTKWISWKNYWWAGQTYTYTWQWGCHKPVILYKMSKEGKSDMCWLWKSLFT